MREWGNEGEGEMRGRGNEGEWGNEGEGEMRGMGK